MNWFNKRKKNEKRYSFNWQGVISIISLVTTIAGFILALYVYNRDIRPVLTLADLHREINLLREEKQGLIEEVEVKESLLNKIETDFDNLQDRENEIREEAISVSYHYYMDTLYSNLINESLIDSSLGKESVQNDIKDIALDELGAIPQEDLTSNQLEGLMKAIDFINENITNESEVYDLLFYKIDEKQKEIEK